MATTYTSTIALRLPDPGDLTGTWGTNDNGNMVMVEYEMSRSVELAMDTPGTGYTFSTPTGTWWMPTTTAQDDATPAGYHRCRYVTLTGPLTEDSTLIIGGATNATAIDKTLYIKNNTSGGFAVRIQNSTLGSPSTYIQNGYGAEVQLIASGATVDVKTKNLGIEDIAISGTGSYNTAGSTGTNNIPFGLDTGANLHASSTLNTLLGYNVGANASGSSTADNVMVGDNIFASGATTTPVGNVVLGSGSANTVTTALTDSIVIGRDAAGSSVTVDDSIVIGTGAASGGSSAVSSVIIGHGALVGSAASGTVAIGLGVLPAGSTGANNIVLGTQTSGASFTGADNIRIGRNAGRSMTSAQQNVIIGAQAGELVATSTGQVLIGVLAGQNLTGGSGGNVVLGSAAGVGLTTGSNNIAIGTLSQSGTTGNANIAIGNQCQSGTTGSNNIAIGNNAGNFITTQSNCVLIGYENGYTPPANGYLAFGIDTTNPTLYGSIPNGNYTIENSTDTGNMLKLSSTNAALSNSMLKIESANTSSTLVNAIEVETDSTSTYYVTNIGQTKTNKDGIAHRFQWNDLSAVDPARVGEPVTLIPLSGPEGTIADYADSDTDTTEDIIGVVASDEDCGYIFNESLADGEAVITHGWGWIKTSLIGTKPSNWNVMTSITKAHPVSGTLTKVFIR